MNALQIQIRMYTKFKSNLPDDYKALLKVFNISSSQSKTFVIRLFFFIEKLSIDIIILSINNIFRAKTDERVSTSRKRITK